MTESSPVPVLAMSAVSAGYGRTTVLEAIDLTISRGETVALLGPNGAGKTTLLRAVTRLLSASAGTINIDGTDVGRLRANEVARLGVAHVPEGRGIFPGLSLEENLNLGTFALTAAARQVARPLEIAHSLFPWIAGRERQPAGTLSGGEQQMVAIARALISQPRLLLLDEPSLGLSPRMVGEVFRALEAIRSRGVTILLAEQNLRRALDLADRGYVLNGGRIALQGSAGELKSDSVYHAYMLGESEAG